MGNTEEQDLWTEEKRGGERQHVLVGEWLWVLAGISVQTSGRDNMISLCLFSVTQQGADGRKFSLRRSAKAGMWVSSCLIITPAESHQKTLWHEMKIHLVYYLTLIMHLGPFDLDG